MLNFIVLNEELNKRKGVSGGPLGNQGHGLPVATPGVIPNIAMQPIVRHVKPHRFERRIQ